MVKIPEEKRTYPRIKTNLKIEISEGIFGDSVNLSEGGVGFNSAESISSPTIPLKIGFPERKFELKTKARLVWKRDLEDGSSLYGVEFVGLNETQKAELRRELIKSQIDGLLREIKDSQIKNDVLRFFFKGYIRVYKQNA